MANYKGTKTEQNLMTAFSGESQARNKYSYYASAAKKAGLELVAKTFELTADNEKEHAKLWFKELGGIGDMEHNLRSAIEGEHYEWSQMYKEFAETARQEGFDELAIKFELTAKVEAEHEKRYEHMLDMLQNNTMFLAEQPTEWICMNCGLHIVSASAPELCPLCAHPKAYFKRLEK